MWMSARCKGLTLQAYIILGLTQNDHVLFNLSSESRLAGHLGDMVSDVVVSSGVEAFVAKPGVSAKGIKQGAAALVPLGSANARFTCRDARIYVAIPICKQGPGGWSPTCRARGATSFHVHE